MSSLMSHSGGGAPTGADARSRARTHARSWLGQEIVMEIGSEEQLVPFDREVRKAMEGIALH